MLAKQTEADSDQLSGRDYPMWGIEFRAVEHRSQILRLRSE